MLKIVGAALAIPQLQGRASDGKPAEYRTGSPTQAVASTSADATDAEAPTDTDAQEGEAGVVIRSHRLVTVDTGYGREAVVRAHLKNVGDHRSPYVEATATFYDEAGDLIDTNFDDMLDLAPGEVCETYLPYLGAASDAEGHAFSGSYDPYRPLPAAENVDLLEHALEVRAFEAFVVWRAKNTRQDPIDYLEARVKFYANDGDVLSTNFTNITDVGAGETWKFRADFVSWEPAAHERLGSQHVSLTDSALA